MIYTIDEIKKRTISIARSYGIRRMFLFGSYARGEATDNSDVDIIVEKGKMQSLIQYFSFVSELEDSLKCHVDVITSGIEDIEFLNRIRSEEVLLYEEQ